MVVTKADKNKDQTHKRKSKNVDVDNRSEDDCSNEEDPQCALYWEMLTRRGTYVEENSSESECEAELTKAKRSSGIQLDDLARTQGGHVETVVQKGKGVMPEYSSDLDVGDVMILDRATFSKEVTSNQPFLIGENREYRDQVLNEMRKPYNKEEYDKLHHDIQVRNPIKRHMDLRNGRERSYSYHNKTGKSLLDHYPDLKRKLGECGDDKSKRLKILRGFFFWLQNLSQEKVFRPWQDSECLALVQGPGESIDDHRGEKGVSIICLD